MTYCVAKIGISFSGKEVWPFKILDLLHEDFI